MSTNSLSLSLSSEHTRYFYLSIYLISYNIYIYIYVWGTVFHAYLLLPNYWCLELKLYSAERGLSTAIDLVTPLEYDGDDDNTGS